MSLTIIKTELKVYVTFFWIVTLSILLILNIWDKDMYCINLNWRASCLLESSNSGHADLRCAQMMSFIYVWSV